ncbi:Uncharacterised protein [Mycobacteroides abscessus subsp. abscessus]|nr:Uncharacterised protein [Mycobacteroides abscessus subsp. abscessus]
MVPISVVLPDSEESAGAVMPTNSAVTASESAWTTMSRHPCERMSASVAETSGTLRTTTSMLCLSGESAGLPVRRMNRPRSADLAACLGVVDSKTESSVPSRSAAEHGTETSRSIGT